MSVPPAETYLIRGKILVRLRQRIAPAPRALLPLCLLACTALSLRTAQAPLRADSRASFVIDQIAARNANLSAAVRDEKYGEMRASIVNFYRGTAHLFWAEFGASPLLSTFGSDNTRIWLEGDAHSDNMGSFTNSAGTLVYDLNDFDEAVIGDYQLDLFRLATSLVLVARQNGGFGAADEETVVNALSDGYLSALASYVGNDGERTRLFTEDTTYGLLDDFLSDVAADYSRQKLLDRYTVKGPAGRTFDFNNSDLQPVPLATAVALREALPAYGATLSGALRYSSPYFKVKSVAQRLHAGIGSLGTPRYYLLIEGPTTRDEDDRILDVKAQDTPSAFATLDPIGRKKTDAASGGDPAMRVVKASQALVYHLDDHLGRLCALGLRFSVRERSPYKETLDTSELTSLTRLTKLASQWGAVLATAHARADRDADPQVIPYEFEREVLNQIGPRKSQFKTRVRQIATSYATQVEADYQTFLKWLSS